MKGTQDNEDKVRISSEAADNGLINGLRSSRADFYGIMSVRGPEQEQPVHGERRMAIMNEVYGILSLQKYGRSKNRRKYLSKQQMLYIFVFLHSQKHFCNLFSGFRKQDRANSASALSFSADQKWIASFPLFRFCKAVRFQKLYNYNCGG